MSKNSKESEKTAVKVKQILPHEGKVNFQAECRYQKLLARNHYITTSIYMYIYKS